METPSQSRGDWQTNSLMFYQVAHMVTKRPDGWVDVGEEFCEDSHS